MWEMIPNKKGDNIAPEKIIVIVLAILLFILFIYAIIKMGDRLLT